MTAPVFEAGLYRGVPEDIYHADRGSISSTQARRLLEVTPHRWKHEQDNPRPSTSAMEWGTALHTLVLGVGAPPVDTGYEKWQTDKAKAKVAEIREAGGIPLKPKEFESVRAAAQRLHTQPEAARLLASGEPELSAWARDPQTGLMLRARFDWMHWTAPGTAVICDVKKSNEPGPDEFRWSVDSYRYYQQQPWYQRVAALLGIRTAFVFLVVCSDPPYEPYVVELPPRAVELGERDNARALAIYAQCLADDEWPSHDTRIHEIDLPARAYRREDYL